MSYLNPNRPSLQQLIADNTMKYTPDMQLYLTAHDFDTLTHFLRKHTNNDWYVQNKEFGADNQVAKVFLRLKSHKLVNLTITNTGTIYTVFMKEPTAQRYVLALFKLMFELKGPKKSTNS